MLNPQLDRRGELTHLLTTEGLPRRHVERLLEMARAQTALDDPQPPVAPEMPVFLCLPDADTSDRDAYAAAAASLSMLPVPLEPQAVLALAETVAALAPGVLILRHGQSGAMGRAGPARAQCGRRQACRSRGGAGAGAGHHRNQT